MNNPNSPVKMRPGLRETILPDMLGFGAATIIFAAKLKRKKV